MNAGPRPITILVAALGGEGGGVLTNWVISAAARHGLLAQSTSIPGVAQRTGATTYYIEIMPVPLAELDGRRPILALLPGVGDIDILLASELLEAGRAVGAGFVTPERTLVIASTSRALVMDEKTAMGDGRLDGDHLIETITRHAQRSLLFDMDALAARSGSVVNAIMLGAIAGCGRLPIPAESFEAAIGEDGKAVDANRRAFRAGLEAIRAQAPRADGAPGKRRRPPSSSDLERKVAEAMPAAARETALEGVRRLIAYQDLAYAQLYLRRLERVRLAEAAAGTQGRLLSETARHLAVRMSFEDVIRVAQAKVDPARFVRIVEEMRIGPDDPYAIVEFLKPGIDEICALLPPWLARRILAWSEHKGWLNRVYWAMEVNTLSVTGYLRFRFLAKLRPWRPRTYRFEEEQKAIEAWLDLIVEAVNRSTDLALEIAQCARLIKGYGDTYRHGTASYRQIETHLIRPVLAHRIPVSEAIDAIASARTAALVDAEGESLARCLAEFERRPRLDAAAE